jgi:hypothetical protein
MNNLANLGSLNLRGGTVGTTPPFSPNDISGLRAWWNAEDNITIGTGTNVNAWGDKTSNGYNLQSSSGNRPTYESNIQNSKHGVRFSSGGNQYIFNDFLADEFTGSDVPFTFFMAVKNVDAGTGGSYDYFSFGNSSTSTPLIDFIVNETVFSPRIRDDASSFLHPTGGTASGNTSYVIVVRTTGTVVTLFVNGVQVSLSNSNFDDGTTTLDQFTIGCLRRVSNSTFFDGYFFEAGIYNVAVSDGQMAQISSYLNSGWAIY